MQPVLTQVPPTRWRSISATFMPAPVSRPARAGPAWPAPTMIASNACALTRGSQMVVDQEERAADRDHILDQGRGEVLSEQPGEGGSEGGADISAEYRAGDAAGQAREQYAKDSA